MHFHTVAVIACIESPLSALISRDPLMCSFSKKVGKDLEDFALLRILSVTHGRFFSAKR